MLITNKKGKFMKQKLGPKLGTLYQRSWKLFLFSIFISFLGIIFFHTHILILCVIGIMLFSSGIYYLLDLLFHYIIVYQNGFRVKLCVFIPSIIILYHEIDLLEQEKRKYHFLGHLYFRTYYHFIHIPYDTLFTVSEKEYHNLSFLLDKINMVTFQKQKSRL